MEGAPAKEAADKGEKVGGIPRDCPSPTLKKNIAMEYSKDGFHKSGTEVEVVIHRKHKY